MAQHAGYARVAFNFALSSFKVGLDQTNGEVILTLSVSLMQSNTISLTGVKTSHRMRPRMLSTILETQ